MPDNEAPNHETIEARFGRNRALIDLAIAQLRQTGAPDSDKIPINMVASCAEGWPECDVPPWTIAYGPSPTIVTRSPNGMRT